MSAFCEAKYTTGHRCNLLDKHYIVSGNRNYLGKTGDSLHVDTLNKHATGRPDPAVAGWIGASRTRHGFRIHLPRGPHLRDQDHEQDLRQDLAGEDGSVSRRVRYSYTDESWWKDDEKGVAFVELRPHEEIVSMELAVY